MNHPGVDVMLISFDDYGHFSHKNRQFSVKQLLFMFVDSYILYVFRGFFRKKNLQKSIKSLPSTLA
jgi:hypothetical protein